MGVKYSAQESQELIQAMTNNLQVANEVTDRLSSGCDHLISSLDSGELTGAAYTAGKGLFTEIIIPSIKKLQAAIDDIQLELTSYKNADAQVSGYGDLDMDQLKELKKLREEQLAIVEAQIQARENWLNQIKDFFTLNWGKAFSEKTILYNTKSQIESGIQDLDDKIEKLEFFVSQVSQYFSDSLEVLGLAIQGATQLSKIIVDSDGNYYADGVDMSWVQKMKDVKIVSHAKRDFQDSETRAINKASRDMMLSEDGDAYYRAELKKRLKGHDKSEWDKIIDDYNHTLKIDETGNIIEIHSLEQGYVVSKNGKYDADYTHLVNKKFDELKAQNFEANSVEFWSGVAQIFSGLGVYFASGALEVLSIIAGPPTAGTSIVAGTAASVSGVQYGNVLIASGAVTSLSAITKTALQNGEIQVDYSSNYDSWQANKPTSKTISGRGGKLIEGRVGNRKVKIRVDLEPNSGAGGQGKLQVQSGSGKSGYDINRHLNINEITGKDYIRNWVNKTGDIKNQTKSVKEEIIERLWKGYQEMVN
ncbi:virulence protein [Streptococcus oralis]|uniref:virulence protein n=1 Tax=Streptococcus oralis TaxID=1303 RepID=UPI00228353D6|nr:virulence protein [Streptococcus oralis]MCY7086593.1 LXG domain-containing protein [Streptococcus oralis]